ncbi:uncharacterized protein LOC118735764 [Rhagoletis pomonella]|uniref:uncharacterized protein LOC118735764 n=1 Tax=Rhagoletis pomonella TaxID=28610 RepID=UPI001780CA02|nr:uncharacterized protein LOC118735764 [Rhagoletis pomonella]
MEKWEEISKELTENKINAEKSYKCICKNIKIKTETVKKHLNVLLSSLNNIGKLIRRVNNTLTKAHQLESYQVFSSVRDKLVSSLSRYNVEFEIPTSYKQHIEIDFDIWLFEGTSDTEEEQKEIVVQEEISTQTNIVEIAEQDTQTETSMTQTTVAFIKTASSILPEFDGKPENLPSFLDALDILEQIKENHEAIAVSMIKTKLKGTARNFISNETTIQEIKRKLKNAIKGESVEVLTAKLLNIQQRSKTANQYTAEIEKLTKSLEGAYISDGLTTDLATKYATQTAVKAMCKNCSNDKVKTIMQAGTFTSMNEAVSKFTNSCKLQVTLIHYCTYANKIIFAVISAEVINLAIIEVTKGVHTHHALITLITIIVITIIIIIIDQITKGQDEILEHEALIVPGL